MICYAWACGGGGRGAAGGTKAGTIESAGSFGGVVHQLLVGLLHACESDRQATNSWREQIDIEPPYERVLLASRAS